LQFEVVMSDEAMNNFTPRAQQVLALARKEADRFNHNFVGTELDLYANYKINTWANYQLGYGHFFVGDYIKDTAGSAATDADWLYTQLTFTF